MAGTFQVRFDLHRDQRLILDDEHAAAAVMGIHRLADQMAQRRQALARPDLRRLLERAAEGEDHTLGRELMIDLGT